MIRLRLTPACVNGYNGQTGAWVVGTEKDVEDAEATRLLGSFPDWFERVHPAKPIAEGSPVTKPAKGQKK